MDRSKVTPCRQVGLSRKKNTPGKTVETLLNISNSVDSITGVKKTPKSEIHKKSEKGVQTHSHDTPCRQVGLSRKRKTSTPLNKIKNRKIQNYQSLSSSNISEISNETSTSISSVKEQKLSNCAKTLSTKFCSTNSSQDTIQKDLQRSTDLVKCSPPIIDEKLSEAEIIVAGDSLKSEENFSKNKEEACNNTENITLTEVKCLSEKYQPKDLTKSSENVDTNNQGSSQFIKVSYKNEKVCPNQEKLTSTDSLAIKMEEPLKSKNLNIDDSFISNKTKFNHKIFDDDDDFEISPSRKKSRKMFGRFKTETQVAISKKKDSKVNKPWRKTVSVGDSKLVRSVDSNNCCVKLERIKNATKNSPKTRQELSDDDFEISTSTPREDIKTNVNNIKKELEEKRQILEDLKRAKSCKKLHNTEELKNLTLRWEKGCRAAIKDLLEQLNRHTQMDMETLLNKLNIPQDFMALSQ